MRWVDLLERLKRATGLTDRQVAALEKRRALRVWRRVGLIGVRTGNEKVNMQGLNFGASGMRVETPIRLRKDEVVVLFRARQPEELQHRQDIDVDDDAPRARVVWVRKRKDALSFECGMSFLIDTPSQRKAAAHFLLDDCRVGIRNPKELRKSPRITADMRGLVMTTDCNTSDIMVKDIAVGGLLAIGARSIERNTGVDVKVFLPDSSSAMTCKGTVVRCLKIAPRSFELGIAFTSVGSDHRERLVTCLSKMMNAAS